MGKSQKKIKPTKTHHPMTEFAVGSQDDREVSIYRGKIVHYITILEDKMDWIILEYYLYNAPDKRKYDFINSVLMTEKFNLMFKFSIISFMVKNSFPEFEQKHPYLLSTLDEVITLRNKYAHYKAMSLKHGNQTTHILNYPKTKKSKPDVSTALLNETTSEIFYGKYWRCKVELVVLLELIRDKNKKRGLVTWLPFRSRLLNLFR